MGIFINPFTDFGFKHLFGQEALKEHLISFLNELLSLYDEKIIDITYLNPEQVGETPQGRKSFYDIHCQNDKGEYIIVEIQREWHANFLND